jgi:CRP-like cAMP-binding protein
METLGQDLETMRRVPLAPEHVEAIRAVGGETTYPAGTIVMDIGEPLDRFVYVLEGEIEGSTLTRASECSNMRSAPTNSWARSPS